MKMIDVSEFLSKIKLFDYILIKVDTPYMPSNFPCEYPVGKDMDIIVTKEDFSRVVKAVRDFSIKYLENFEIRIREKEGNFRLRFEIGKRLHYQMDISYKFPNLPLWFIEESISNRVLKRDVYYVTEVKYEIVYRIASYNPLLKKRHHLQYIQNNKKYIDRALVDKIGLQFHI